MPVSREPRSGELKPPFRKMNANQVRQREGSHNRGYVTTAVFHDADVAAAAASSSTLEWNRELLSIRAPPDQVTAHIVNGAGKVSNESACAARAR